MLEHYYLATLYGVYRALVTSALLPYLESIASCHGCFPHARSVTELLLHVATSTSVPVDDHAPQLSLSMLLIPMLHSYFAFLVPQQLSQEIKYRNLYMYRLSLIGTDGTATAEFTLFGRVARQVIGKPVVSLMRSASKSQYGAVSFESEHMLPDIAALVSQKFTFSVY